MRRSAVLIAVLLIAASAWAFVSPRLAAKQFRDAVQTGDEDGLRAVMDFPAVREHLRADLRASRGSTFPV